MCAGTTVHWRDFASSSLSAQAYHLRLETEWTRPRIWCRIQVYATIDLPALHKVLCDCLGWQAGDAHEFIFADGIYGASFSLLASASDNEVLQENGVRLQDALGSRDAFLYVQDADVRSCCRVQVEALVHLDHASASVTCLDGLS